VKPKTAKRSAAEIAEEERMRLAREARENPHAFFSFEECGLIFGFSRWAMTRLNAAGAPVWFRKMNPAMVRAWMAENPEAAAKICAEEDEQP
jgi:hypothetical protein